MTVHGSAANYVSLPESLARLAGQKAISTARFRTDWVNVRALADGPNIGAALTCLCHGVQAVRHCPACQWFGRRNVSQPQ